MDATKTWGRRFASAALAALCATSVIAWPGLAMADTGAPAAEQEGSTIQTNQPEVQRRSIRGTDFLEPDAELWDVLRLEGDFSEPVYVDVIRADGEELAHGQRYDISAEPVTNEYSIAHILTIGLGGNTTVRGAVEESGAMPLALILRTAPRGGETIFEGHIYPVYASLVDGDGNAVGQRLLGIRTVADGELSGYQRNVGAGPTFYDTDDEGGRTTYRLANLTSIDNTFAVDRFLVEYREVEAGVSSGTVTYVLESSDKALDGTVIRTDTFGGVGDHTAEVPVMAPIEQSFFREGKYYRVVSQMTQSSFAALHAGNANHVVRVKEVTGVTASAYQVTLRFVDQSGNLLWSDSVDVKGTGYQYTVPTTFSTKSKSGETDFYRFSTVRGGSDVWGNSRVIRFDEAKIAEDFLDDGAGGRVLEVVYGSKDVDKTVTYTIVEVDGSNATEIGRETYEVTPETSATYTPSDRVVDGVNYTPWTGNTDPILCDWESLASGIDLLQYVYYVPEDYVPGPSYELTIQDVNVATGDVLRTRTQVVDSSMNSYMRIVGDEAFSQDGIDYVRLAGQESGVMHSYFTPARTYTFYYRDVNDVLNANTVITRTQIIETERVVEVPGNVTYAYTALPVALNPDGTAAGAALGGDAGAPGAAAAGAAPAGAAAPATVDAGLTAGDGTTIIDDDANPLANLEGEDTATERIPDDELPLAGGLSQTEQATLRGIVAGAAAAVIAYLIWAIWKRRRDEDESNESVKA